MRIAYLISAYTQPRAFVNIIRALQAEDVDFYIHIDKKVSMEPFSASLSDMDNVHFVSDENRVKIYWGGYSQVEMQLAMLEMVFASGKEYDRVVNLTGTDYPVFSRQAWYNMLADQEREYIIGFDVTSEVITSESINKRPLDYKYLEYHRMDGNIWIRRLVRRLHIPKPNKYHLENYRFCFGSEYWALSFACVKQLVAAYKADDTLQKIFRYSFVPSEAWVHTMFFASAYAQKGVCLRNAAYHGLQELAPLCYFNYRSDGIKILDENDFDIILASGKPFARKVLPGPSDRLIELLQKHASEEQAALAGPPK